MTNQDKNSQQDPFEDAIATAVNVGASAAKATSDAVKFAADGVIITATAVGDVVAPAAQQFVEQSTETIGYIVTPIAEHPLTQYVSKVPGINLLMTALGQVDVDQAQQEVDHLRQQYPLETPAQLAQRIMADVAMKAGGIGLLTNFIPPLALTLFAVDIAAVTTLQSEMIYRIAAAYGFSLKDPARRGEVLAIFGLSLGGSSALKIGLGLVELIPLVGAAVGASSNAGLIYTLGYAASQFYEAKKVRQDSRASL
ncbi:MAG: EcsC family protein [Leptolyngbyaceae cyanobacterium RM1_406_9]|nr:EcsC family protein [Leptolyngbyaceae cyanobacterium SM1_4_3]NJO75465.1 EcsC family protein [Leptolyngbyaceae cyanobacterium RM1_406_9]